MVHDAPEPSDLLFKPTPQDYISYAFVLEVSQQENQSTGKEYSLLVDKKYE